MYARETGNISHQQKKGSICQRSKKEQGKRARGKVEAGLDPKPKKMKPEGP